VSCTFDYTGIELLDPCLAQTEMSTEILSIAADCTSHRETEELASKNIGLFLDMQALYFNVFVKKLFRDLKIRLYLANLVSEWGEKQLVTWGKERITCVSTRVQVHLRGLIEDVQAREEKCFMMEVDIREVRALVKERFAGGLLRVLWRWRIAG